MKVTIHWSDDKTSLFESIANVDSHDQDRLRFYSMDGTTEYIVFVDKINYITFTKDGLWNN